MKMWAEPPELDNSGRRFSGRIRFVIHIGTVITKSFNQDRGLFEKERQ